jgi:hypothetical protein
MESTMLDKAACAIAQEPPESWATWIDYVVEAMEGSDLLHSEQPALVASWRARSLAMLQELQRSLQRRQIAQQRHRAVERKRCYQ